MKASERLRALVPEEGGLANQWDSGPYPKAALALLDAVPELVAVVEAAERARCEHDLSPGECTKTDLRLSRACERCTALHALAAKLNPEEGA